MSVAEENVGPGYAAIYVEGGVRPKGWYVEDLRRSTRYAIVLVGGRHATRESAESDAAGRCAS